MNVWPARADERPSGCRSVAGAPCPRTHRSKPGRRGSASAPSSWLRNRPPASASGTTPLTLMISGCRRARRPRRNTDDWLGHRLHLNRKSAPQRGYGSSVTCQGRTKGCRAVSARDRHRHRRLPRPGRTPRRHRRNGYRTIMHVEPSPTTHSLKRLLLTLCSTGHVSSESPTECSAARSRPKTSSGSMAAAAEDRPLRGGLPVAFLASTTTRLAIDVAKSARVRRETHIGPWLPAAEGPRPPGFPRTRCRLTYMVAVVSPKQPWDRPFRSDQDQPSSLR